MNPAFPSPCQSAGPELAVAEFLSSHASLAGMPVEFHDVLPGRPNFLTSLAPLGRTRQRVLLAPHLDTVGVPGEPATLFHPRRHQGRIYGRGACDTKGSIAAMFTVLTRLAKSGRRPAQTEIVFSGLVDEENAQAGSRALVKKGFKADLAVVGEPTRLKVVTAHKGDVWLRLDTSGKAAHGARPQLGRNAVYEMARIVSLLEGEYASSLRTRSHLLLGQATVNVGSINGGSQPNIVPAHCFITIDRRTLPGETDAGVRSEIRELLRRHGLKASLGSARNAACLPLETDSNLPLVRDLLRAAQQRRPAGADYFCDAAVLAQGGIPSVVFGPGDIAQAHTAEEWISIQSLEQAADLLERFLRSLP